MPPRRLLFVRRLCSATASDAAGALTPSTISKAADLAAAAVLNSPRRFESYLLSLAPRAVLHHPDFARLTLSRLLPAVVPSLRFLRSLSPHLPGPAAAPEPATDPAPDTAPANVPPPLPGIDKFLRRLPPHLAADVAELLSSHLGIHLSLRAFNAASHYALHTARPDLVFRLFSAFSSSPEFPGDATTVGCLAWACAAEGRPLDGLALLRDAAHRGTPPPANATADIIGALAADGNFGKVSDALHFMISTGCTPDEVIYQRVIQGLFRRGMGREALRVFREIKQRGYEIDRVTYSTVIHGLYEMQLVGDAQQLWDEMVDRGIKPNEYAYCSLVTYYCRAGDLEKARLVYDEMLQKGLKQTTVSCNILIKGFCVHGRVYDALEVFEEMSVKGIKHDVITYDTLIRGLWKARKLDSAIRMYELMLSSGLEPTVSTFSPLICAMCKNGKVHAAVDLFELMRAKGLEPLVWCNDSIIYGFCKINRSDEGLARLAGMLKDNIKPRKQTFDCLVESLCTSGRLDDALVVLNIMFKVGLLSSGLEPTESTFGPLICAMCKNGQVHAAVDLIGSIRAKGSEPLVWSNDSIIKGFCKINRSDEGMAWLAGMLKDNIKPRKQTFDCLVESLSTSGRLADALAVLNIMFKVGFELGRFACTRLVDKLGTGNVCILPPTG